MRNIRYYTPYEVIIIATSTYLIGFLYAMLISLLN